MSEVDFRQIHPCREGDILWCDDTQVTVVSLDTEEECGDQGVSPGIYWSPDIIIVEAGGERYSCLRQHLSHKPSHYFKGPIPEGCLTDQEWAEREAVYRAFCERFSPLEIIPYLRVGDLPETNFREGDIVRLISGDRHYEVMEVNYCLLAGYSHPPMLGEESIPGDFPYTCRPCDGQGWAYFEGDQIEMIKKGPHWSADTAKAEG